MTGLPTGTVTFLFTDIEGSTRLLQELGPAYGPVQNDHMRIMRDAIGAGGGVEIRTEGDAFFVVFPTATGAVEAATRAQRGLHEHQWPHGRPLLVRMGMHTGEGNLGGDDYLAIDVNRAARIAAVGHGGQVLLSAATRALVENDLPDGVVVQDLGEHRLKDLTHPEHLHELKIDGLPTEFAPLKSLETPSNLPAELTSFVGRDHELETVKTLLADTRLLTLTGPGGSGKTRLAIRAASDLLPDFPDGVFFVELASISEPHLVPGAIASAMRKREEGARSALETLEIDLRYMNCLLVLDNFEQVVDASPMVGTLLAAAPKVRMLVTSRSPLRLSGEREFPVPPMGLPDPDRLPGPEDLTRFEALALFVERAVAIDPGFVWNEENSRAVVEICRRLDGLPLAIELAVSRLRLLSPTALLERLDSALPVLSQVSRDLPARQRTLRGAIAWSYDLLAPEVAAFFRRVCVFAGGFTIAALEAIADPEGELGLDPLEGLEYVRDTSLVRRRSDVGLHDRFEILQTIREFGLEKLDEGDETSPVRRRHAHYFLELSETSDPELRGPDIERFLEMLRLEHDNLRAALNWAIEQDEGAVGLRFASALWRFWQLNGDLTSGRGWADQVLALPSAAGRTRERAYALLAKGSLSYWAQATSEMSVAYAEAMDIFLELDESPGIALATYDIAFQTMLSGDIAAAGEMLRTCNALFKKLGDTRGVADTLFALSGVSRKQGDLVAARAEAEEALRLHKELGDVFGIHGDLYILGRALSDAGEFDMARDLFIETLGMAEYMGNSTGLALSLDMLALQATGEGRPARGVKLAGAAEAIKESVAGEAPPELLDLPDPRNSARQTLGEEEIHAAWNEGRSMSIEDALSFAREIP